MSLRRPLAAFCNFYRLNDRNFNTESQQMSKNINIFAV